MTQSEYDDYMLRYTKRYKEFREFAANYAASQKQKRELAWEKYELEHGIMKKENKEIEVKYNDKSLELIGGINMVESDGRSYVTAHAVDEEDNLYALQCDITDTWNLEDYQIIELGEKV